MHESWGVSGLLGPPPSHTDPHGHRCATQANAASVMGCGACFPTSFALPPDSRERTLLLEFQDQNQALSKLPGFALRSGRKEGS